MDQYKDTYYYLFNRLTDLIEEIKNFQQNAETMFITLPEFDLHPSDNLPDNIS